MSANSAHHQEPVARKFMTRQDFSYEYKITYSTVTLRIRQSLIALHFIDNKVQINVEEALRACTTTRGPRFIRKDLFA
jgi:hypothetical protein